MHNQDYFLVMHQWRPPRGAQCSQTDRVLFCRRLYSNSKPLLVVGGKRKKLLRGAVSAAKSEINLDFGNLISPEALQ